jgi:N6-L-threonylcarbamoyladenine synthase
MYAAEMYNIKNVVVGGGVSANGFLREEMQKNCRAKKIKLFFAQKKYCVDNAAMIALAGYRKIMAGAKTNDSNNINPQLKIRNWKV